MSNRAKVTSVEAIESFRNSLIIYLSKARPTLEEINTDVARTRMWVENEQRLHWEHELRRRKHRLDEAQNAFFSAQMSSLRDVTVAERQAVSKAKIAFDEAEVKLRMVKRWNREVSSQLEPLAKQLGHLHTVLASELPHSIAYLTKVIETLQDYRSASGESHKESTEATPPPAQPATKETNEPQ
ncbi:MAG: hypothetical protein H0X66_01250 [Verrucomicrobia bacterium]|nr:hypothetical protein [Verrucomicrobiota bacterium]